MLEARKTIRVIELYNEDMSGRIGVKSEVRVTSLKAETEVYTRP
jgi:hypothetical protein